MTFPAPPGGTPDIPKEDFVSRHGKRVVVLIFSILAGDALPVIIHNGIDPKERFYTIVAVTLPYTGALVLIFLMLASDRMSDNPYAAIGIVALILVSFLALGAWLRLGSPRQSCSKLADE